MPPNSPRAPTGCGPDSSARFRNQEDVQLVLSPERVLTPVLLSELADAADAAPWLVLFFDTYERTGPFLDGWLHEVMTTDRYGGSLPANVVVVTAGQRAFDTARWGGFADFVTDVPLGPFTEAEARGLLADKGVVAEPVVEEVLRLTGGLPVLVSTLAEAAARRPGRRGRPERHGRRTLPEVGAGSGAPGGRPRLRAAPAPGRGRLPGRRGLPGGRGRRAVRLAAVAAVRQRPRATGCSTTTSYARRCCGCSGGSSPRGWAERHARLAETFGGWRDEAEAGLDAGELWADEAWRELRLAESYHLLCAGPRAALPVVLRDFVDACDSGDVPARRWARILAEAGEDADAEAVRKWGRDLLGGARRRRGGGRARAAPRPGRGSTSRDRRSPGRCGAGALRHGGAYEQALAEYDRAIALDPELARAYRGRAFSRGGLGDYEAGIADLDRADTLAPGPCRDRLRTRRVPPCPGARRRGDQGSGPGDRARLVTPFRLGLQGSHPSERSDGSTTLSRI